MSTTYDPDPNQPRDLLPHEIPPPPEVEPEPEEVAVIVEEIPAENPPPNPEG